MPRSIRLLLRTRNVDIMKRIKIWVWEGFGLKENKIQILTPTLLCHTPHCRTISAERNLKKNHFRRVPKHWFLSSIFFSPCLLCRLVLVCTAHFAEILLLYSTIDMLFKRHNECRFYHIWAFVTTVVAGLWRPWRFLCWLIRQIVRQVWRVVVAPERDK